MHEVFTFASSYRENNLEELVALLSELSVDRKEIIFATEENKAADIYTVLFKYIKSFPRIPPIKLTPLPSIYKNSDNKFNEKEKEGLLVTPSLTQPFTIESCKPFKLLENDAIIAYAIASSSCGFIRGPILSKILEQLNNMKEHIGSAHELLQSSGNGNKQDYEEKINMTHGALDSCLSQLKNFTVSARPHDTIRKSSFEALSKLLSHLAMFCATLNFDSLQGRIHFIPLNLIMSPRFQYLWAERKFSFLVEQDSPAHFIYTDASIKHEHCGSFSGILTLATGHIIDIWNYQLQEAITDSSTCELIAIVFALFQIKDIRHKILIQTDSEIAIEALLKLLNKGEINSHFKRNPLLGDLTKLLPRQSNIKIQHVKGHANCSGNHFADRAACFAHVYGEQIQWKAWALGAIRALKAL